MMHPKRKRILIGIVSIVFLISMGVGLILYALKQNINLFFTPTELQQTLLQPHQTIRVGGYVKKKSIVFSNSGQHVNFIVTDNSNTINVIYQGILPSLFREGQGVVVTGQLQDGHTLKATEVLAKHDEKYMPASLAKALGQRGVS